MVVVVVVVIAVVAFQLDFDVFVKRKAKTQDSLKYRDF